MNWDGVIGSVASVINTALPLFLNTLDEDKSPGAVQVGPATLFEKDGLHIGNFLGGEQLPTLLVNFTSPAGGQQDNLAVELPYGNAFPVTEWLQKYTDGSVTVGVTGLTEGAKTEDAGLLQGLFTLITSTVLGAKDTITAVVNPKLTVAFRLEADRNVVAVAAIGAAAVLGTTYMITARNNAGRQGSRSGDINPRSGLGDGSFEMALPTGVDYSDGIYDMQVQLAINLTGEATATDPAVRFASFTEQEQAQILAGR
jgi:hypothetical protein